MEKSEKSIFLILLNWNWPPNEWNAVDNTIITLSIGTDRPGLKALIPQKVASDQGLHFLPLIQQFLHRSVDNEMVIQILGQVW